MVISAVHLIQRLGEISYGLIYQNALPLEAESLVLFTPQTPNSRSTFPECSKLTTSYCVCIWIRQCAQCPPQGQSQSVVKGLNKPTSPPMGGLDMR